ncbi:MAG TPA: M28 family metallopeptidase [Gemmatimonadaceae bacterium]|nr:M28 family metallopeptidase [Gemmatimonadaceae bacterium]
MARRVRTFLTLAGVATTLLATANCGTSASQDAPDSTAGASMGLSTDQGLSALIADISPAEIRATDSVLVSFGTRQTLSDTMSATRGIGAARHYLFAKFSGYSKACGGCLHVEYDPAMVQVRRFPKQPTVNVVNVLAWLPGRDAKRVVVITGHYDSCLCAVDQTDDTSDAPGADDDASGTSDVVELARVFSKHYPKGLKATLLFAAVAGEEQGLLGSTHLAQRLHDEGYTVVGDMSDDLDGNVTASNGRTDSTTMRIYSADPDNTPSRELSRYAVALGSLYNPNFHILDVLRVDRIGRGTDDEPFVALGEPGIRTTERMEALDRQHSPRDVFADVDFTYSAKIARLNAAVMGSLGLAPAAPDSVRARRQRPLGQQWQLSWKPVSDATGYEVLVRPTTSPTWQRVIPVGKVTSYTLDEQLDDLWAAVRSVDAQGHTSLAVVVPPVRRRRSARRPARAAGGNGRGGARRAAR